MIRLLTSGGLGDAAMSFAKAERLDVPRHKFEIYHARARKDGLDDAIVSFYETQGISSKIIKTECPTSKEKHTGRVLDEWVVENYKKYDYYLGTHWSTENGSDLPSWQISPFPQIKYSRVDGLTVIINPSSGGSQAARKSFDRKDVESFMEMYPKTCLVGRGNEVYYEEFPNSYFNKTTMEELVNMIASSNVVITPEGFVAYFAAMCGKKVFVKSENAESIHRRKHPSWDMTIVEGLCNPQ